MTETETAPDLSGEGMWTTAEVVAVKYDERGLAPGGMADIFLQWKGTDVCFDFTCGQCGGDGHFDGFFAYAVKCPHCGAIYVMPATIYALYVSASYHKPVVPETRDELDGLEPPPTDRVPTEVDRLLWEIREIVGPAAALSDQRLDHLRNRVDAALQLYDQERRDVGNIQGSADG
jgi:hypothetical protein